MNQDFNKPLIILGAGGHAQVIADLLRLAGAKVLGILDPSYQKDNSRFGLKILGGDDVLQNYSADSVLLANGLGALPEQNSRWELAGRMRNKGYHFPPLIHPATVVAQEVKIASGVQVFAGAVIQPGSSIGEDSIINTSTSIDHDCIVGARCHVAPGVTLSGGVHLQDNVHLGTGTTVIQSCTIGKGSVVAAGSVVHSDIPANVKCIQTRRQKIIPMTG